MKHIISAVIMTAGIAGYILTMRRMLKPGGMMYTKKTAALYSGMCLSLTAFCCGTAAAIVGLCS